jgi:hypothetical protein
MKNYLTAIRMHLILTSILILNSQALADDSDLEKWRGDLFFQDAIFVKFSTHFADDAEIKESGAPRKGFIFSKFVDVGREQKNLLVQKLNENNFAKVESKNIFVKNHMCIVFESEAAQVALLYHPGSPVSLARLYEFKRYANGVVVLGEPLSGRFLGVGLKKCVEVKRE